MLLHVVYDSTRLCFDLKKAQSQVSCVFFTITYINVTSTFYLKTGKKI